MVEVRDYGSRLALVGTPKDKAWVYFPANSAEVVLVRRANSYEPWKQIHRRLVQQHAKLHECGEVEGVWWAFMSSNRHKDTRLIVPRGVEHMTECQV